MRRLLSGASRLRARLTWLLGLGWRNRHRRGQWAELTITLKPMSVDDRRAFPQLASGWLIEADGILVAYAGCTRGPVPDWRFYRADHSVLHIALVADPATRCGRSYQWHLWLRDLDNFVRAVPDLLELGVLTIG